ncbi:MAG: DNA polymerase, partial [Dehalococcoidia bacterium]
MLEFHPDCTRCAFHKTCEHPGIGGRKVRGASIFKRDAVCVVGMAPGWQEDKANRVFEGKSGRLLEGSGKGRGYLGQLPDDVDVWATNAVRCQPPKGVDPKVTQIKACSEWLYDDICALIEKYERVFLLVLGAVAARSVLKSSLKDAFNKQGQTIAKLARHKPVFPVPLPVFATYHPAYLLRENKRTLNAVVVDHMKLLAGALTPSEDGSKAEPLSPVRVGFRDLGRLRPSWDRGRLFFDIETYGIWEGGTAQTVFNPRASAAVDGVPVGKQILTIAVGSKVEGRIHYARARWDDRVRKLTRELLESAASLCGTNLLFDLGYLGADLAWEPAPDQLIEDLCVLSFMQNPDRPEGSLGALGKLLLPDGLEERYGAKGRKHSDWEELLTYNVGDVVNPIGLFDVLEERIAQQGRPENPAVTTRAYSDSMKVMLHMGKHGLRIHPGRLFRRQSKCEAREKRLIEGALKRWEFPLQGKGSGLAKSALFREIVERRPQGIAGGWDLTKKKREVSTAEGNINRATMDEGVPFELRRKAWAVRHHRDNQKLLTTYLRGLSALTERTDRVYAQWFPVPSRFESNDTSYVISGGTRQVRVSCKRPALMTSPKQVKGLFASRYRGGFLLSADYKQLEMRMAALVSGDPVLMGVFEEDRDVHQETLD